MDMKTTMNPLERDEEIKRRISKEKDNMLKEEELFNMMFTRKKQTQDEENETNQ